MSLYAILVILLIGLISFFHWIQGLFSATLSAIIAIIASMMAISYHEPLAELLLGGKMADQAEAMVLVVLFALIYIVLRVIFDKAIPGNLRLPSTVDHVGGALMGAIAGIFAVGTLTVSAEMLPFGPTIAGYSRYELAPERTARTVITGRVQHVDAPVVNELRNDTLDTGLTPMLLPVDDWVVAMAEHLSGKGALGGRRSLTSIHPDWLQELFASRVGIQPGAMTTALNMGSREDVRVSGAYVVSEATQEWAQPGTIRTEALPERVELSSSRALLVIPIEVDASAAGEGNIFRFSTGTVRLVVDGKQYFPVGTFTGGQLLRSRPDDPLFLQISGQRGIANMAFLLDPKAVLISSGDQVSFKPGAFLAVKRLALVDLDQVNVQQGRPPGDQVLVQGSKDKLSQQPSRARQAPSGQASSGQASSAQAPLQIQRVERFGGLFTPINVGTPEDRISNAQMRSGRFSLQDRKFSRLELDGSESITLLRQGEHTVDQLYAPPGMGILEVHAIAPPDAGAAKWAWTDSLRDFVMVASNGARYTPSGAFARVKVGTTDRIVAAYNADGPVPPLATVQDGIPTDVYLVFVVATEAQISELTFKGQPVMTGNWSAR